MSAFVSVCVVSVSMCRGVLKATQETSPWTVLAPLPLWKAEPGLQWLEHTKELLSAARKGQKSSFVCLTSFSRNWPVASLLSFPVIIVKAFVE